MSRRELILVMWTVAVLALAGVGLIVLTTKDAMMGRFPICPEDSRGYYIPFGSQREGSWWTRYECVPPDGTLECSCFEPYCEPEGGDSAPGQSA